MHYRSFCNFTRIKPHLNIQEMVHGYFICIFLPRADCSFRVKNVMNNYKCSQVPPLRSTSQSCTFPYVSTQKEPINCIPAGKKKKKRLLSASAPMWFCAVIVLMEQRGWWPLLSTSKPNRYGENDALQCVYSPIIRPVITLSFSLMEFWSTLWDCSFFQVDENTSCSYSGWYWSRTSQ